MDFSFITARKIVCKSGIIDEAGGYLNQFGKKALIVTDKIFQSTGVTPRLEKELDKYGIQYVYYTGVKGEPDVTFVDEAHALADAEHCDMVISIGGGSLMDVGKAVAGLIPNGGKVKDYLEYVGTGKKVVKEPVPFIAMPTTSGTGSEVTNTAVIASHAEHFKRSMRDEKMLANLVIMDPSLCVGMPPKVTADSGIDEMTHSMEAYTTARRPTPITRAIAFQGVVHAAKYLKRAYDKGTDLEAREGMAYAALCGGMAFSNSGLGAAHGLGMACNIYLPLTHGRAVGIMLPYVMEINAMHIPGLYDEVGEAVTGRRFNNRGEGTRYAIEFIKELKEQIGIPADLKSFNVSEELALKMGKECFGTSMGGNPVQLEAADWGALFNKLR